MDIFVFFFGGVHNFLVACPGRYLAVRMMNFEGCSEGHSSIECPLREIPR